MSGLTLASAIKLRRAAAEDADVCGPICYQAFAAINDRHRFPPDLPSAAAGVGLLRTLFSHPCFYSVVAEMDGQLVGSNCLDERSAIAGIGPITIAHAAQNRSIGRTLMHAVMDRARERGFAGMRLLQAAFHNRSLSLYAKLGFDAREPVSVMQGPSIKRSLEGWTVRPANQGDLEPAARLCESVHGHNRTGELRDGIVQNTAFVVERHGRITGYVSDIGFFGHTVGESNLDMQALIAAADGFSGPGILVPARNSVLFRNEPRGAYLPSVLY